MPFGRYVESGNINIPLSIFSDATSIAGSYCLESPASNRAVLFHFIVEVIFVSFPLLFPRANRSVVLFLSEGIPVVRGQA